jgi:flagellar basal-body rod protein FlgG
MHAQQARIDNIANNLANVNTTGFKKSRMEFQDLLYENLAPTGAQRSDGSSAPTSVEVGHGVRIVSSVRLGSEGLIEVTDNELDMVIQGDGSFKLDRDRNIVTSAGYYLQPQINVPEDATSIGISSDGKVEVILAGDSGTAQEIGQIETARFNNAAGMSQAGENILLATPNSGTPIPGIPGEQGYGSIQQGALEKSNVDVARELVDMITAQRAYELNSKTIQTADDMLQTVNAIRR